MYAIVIQTEKNAYNIRFAGFAYNIQWGSVYNISFACFRYNIRFDVILSQNELFLSDLTVFFNLQHRLL